MGCETEIIRSNSISHSKQYIISIAVSILSGAGQEIDFTERACSDHIADNVNLEWTLIGTDTNGVATLKGISLSPTMLDIVTVAPLQWGKYC